MKPEPLSPGEAIKAELEKRGWTQTDLAAILGKHLPAVSEVIMGKRSITPDMAVSLAGAFGNDPEFWLHLDGSFRLSMMDRREDPGVKRRARVYGMAPVVHMEMRGWINPTRSIAELEGELCRFFALLSLDQEPPFSASTVKSGSHPPSAVERAWCVRGARMASTLKVSKFREGAFERALPGIRSLAELPGQVREVPKALASLGVRFVVVEPLPNSRVDGAAFWLDGESPVIVLSVRWDRIDGFWHALAHELSHIRHRDEFSMDSDLVGETRNVAALGNVESRAEKEAADFLIPRSALQSYIQGAKPLYTKAGVLQFAERAKVHPGIVTGRLQVLKEIPWRAHREIPVKVRAMLAASSLTDGWGHTVPAV